ncbi:MAG: Uma2 family endonuclease [Cytophagales bacterium]|nr:Uma2 family endonuclease [Armatimonadota bacterium]
MTLTKPKATIEDLYKVEEEAEIVNGEMVRYGATGGMPGYAADEVFVSLRQYAKRTRIGVAAEAGPNPGMKFYEGAPIFAVEVRSENDYGLNANTEIEITAKHRDYFAAGTLTVWDVDLLSEEDASVIRKYTAATGSDTPAAVFARGEVADAEPAMPGWAMPVDDLFDLEGTGI